MSFIRAESRVGRVLAILGNSTREAQPGVTPAALLVGDRRDGESAKLDVDRWPVL